MDPSSPEFRSILRYYNVTYDEVVFYEFYHQIGKYLLLAGITVMLWDHITTIPDEIKYIWQAKGRWTIATVLFGFNRYISPPGFILRFIQFLLQNPGRPMCTVNKLTAYWNTVSFACVQIVLMLRIWVMYGKGKRIGFFLSAVYTLALVTSLILLSKQPTTDLGLIEPLPTSLTLCVRSPPTTYFWLLVTASSAEFITLSLFCVKVYLARKDSIAAPILSALFTQGAAYYVVVFCTFTITIPATRQRELYIPLTDQNTVILISCIACNRLILSLRGLHDSQTVVEPTILGTSTKELSVPYISSSEVATSLDRAILATQDKEENVWINGGSDPSNRLENLAQGR